MAKIYTQTPKWPEPATTPENGPDLDPDPQIWPKIVRIQL